MVFLLIQTVFRYTLHEYPGNLYQIKTQCSKTREWRHNAFVTADSKNNALRNWGNESACATDKGDVKCIKLGAYVDVRRQWARDPLSVTI